MSHPGLADALRYSHHKAPSGVKTHRHQLSTDTTGVKTHPPLASKLTYKANLTDLARVCAVYAGDTEIDTADDTGPFDTETLGAADEALRQALDDAAPTDLEAAGWEHVPDEESARLYRITFPAPPTHRPEVA
ncbi:hypothetical protein QBA54_32435 [Streptomyces sp. B21-108]